jgi:hypothetical protein
VQTKTELIHPSRAPRSYIRWSAVFGGAVVGVAFMALFTSLWVALGYGSGINAFSGYINWWVGATGIATAFLAGALAGWLSGSRGVSFGTVHGLTVWGLLVIAAGVFGLPGAAVARVAGSILWTTFWTVLIGLGAAVFGGVMGAGMNAVADDESTAGTEGERRHDGSRAVATNGYHVSRVEEVILLDEPAEPFPPHESVRRPGVPTRRVRTRPACDPPAGEAAPPTTPPRPAFPRRVGGMPALNSRRAAPPAAGARTLEGDA